MTQHKASTAPKIYCQCGKPLRAKVRRDGFVLQCPEHGVVWRYVTGQTGQLKHDVNNDPNDAHDAHDEETKRE